MAIDDGEWYDSQKKRLGREMLLSGPVIGLAFIEGLGNLSIVLVGIFVLLVQLIRLSAVQTGSKEHASNRLFATNPFLVHGSLTVLFYNLVRAVQVKAPTDGFLGTIAIFTILCIALSLLILFAEYLGNSEYFEWWKDRAVEKSADDDTTFWMYIAAKFKQISPIAVTKAELASEKRKGRAKQRLIGEIYTASKPTQPAFARVVLAKTARQRVCKLEETTADYRWNVVFHHTRHRYLAGSHLVGPRLVCNFTTV